MATANSQQTPSLRHPHNSACPKQTLLLPLSMPQQHLGCRLGKLRFWRHCVLRMLRFIVLLQLVVTRYRCLQQSQ